MLTAATAQKPVFTVTNLNAQARLLLENGLGLIWLVGEISNFTAPVSGHWYLTLKDARSQVKCAMFKGSNRNVTFKPANGQQVLVKARISLYEPRGEYQIIIESMLPEGNGRLQQAFEKLKMTLAAEGLFAQARKKSLPLHPQCVGIITSQTGAALFDILNVLKRRDPSLAIIIYPTMVQGEEAAIQIAQAIGRANERNECDVLIVGRGGGSLEDLNCFNHEIVARTIAASRLPIISAVGHEIDVTIADFVADVRAPTPSAAAELVSRDNSHKAETIKRYQQRLAHALRYYLSQQQKQLQALIHALEKQHPTYQLQKQNQQLDDLYLRLTQSIRHIITQHQQMLERKQHQLQLNSPMIQLRAQYHRLDKTQQKLLDVMDRRLLTSRHQLMLSLEKLDMVSPLATLKRGYSITQVQDGTVVCNSSQLKSGDKLLTRFSSGEIYSTVD